MAQRKRWEIKGLSQARSFRKAARVVACARLDDVLALIHQFGSTGDAEVLHQLRIAARRLRYPLETLISNFDRKTTLGFITALNELQDAAGGARDLDVLLAHVKDLAARSKARMPEKFFREVERRRKALYRDAGRALDAFGSNLALTAFQHEIRYAKHVTKKAENVTK